jgi:hypothetical protein
MRTWKLGLLLALAFGAAVYNQQKRGDDCHESGGHVVETGPLTWECRHPAMLQGYHGELAGPCDPTLTPTTTDKAR